MLTALLCSLTTARAGIPQLEENPSAQPESELLLTNTTDLVGLYLEGYNYPIGSWVWAPGTFFPVQFQPMTIVWANTANLPTGLAGITNSVPTSLQGVNAFPLWVTLWPQSNTVTVLQPWSDQTLTEFSVPDWFPSWQVYEANLYPSCVLFGINYTNWETLVEEGYTQFTVPQVITHAWLMDVGSRDIYWNNLEAQCAVAAAASAASMSGRVMPMDDDGGGSGGSDPCSITNLLQSFYVTNIVRNASGSTTITWQSCQFFRYLVFSANSLSTNTQWVPQAYVWGATNVSSTTWTDLSTTNNDGNTVTQRFYRVQRVQSSPISAGAEHSVALTQDRKLWAWGRNDGNLGDGLDSAMRANGDYVEEYLPYPSDVANLTACGVQTISNPVAVAAGGDDFTVVVDATGTAWSFGENNAGQLGNPSEPANNNSIYPVPAPISGLNNIVSVAAGYQHALALRSDMTVFACGDNSSGQLGLGGAFTGQTNAPVQCMNLTQIVAVAAGEYHSVALDVNSQVWSWGWGLYGQLGNGNTAQVNVPTMLTTISNVIAIAAGSYHTIALTADRTVYTWGSNKSGELGRTNVTVGPSSYDASPGQIPPSVLSNVVSIAGGDSFSVAVTGNGQVYAWGDNQSGELATNSTDVPYTNSPIPIAGIGNAVWVAAPVVGDDAHDSYHQYTDYGGTHVVAMTLDPVDGTGQTTNRYWGWGDATAGEVGNGLSGFIGDVYQQNTNQYTPAQLQFCTRCQREVQLGTGGVFTAQCNGTLYLYFNGEIGQFNNYSGSYTATVNGVTTNVPAHDGSGYGTGIAVGTVTQGSNYAYSASGLCTYDANLDKANADGRDSVSSNLVTCSFLYLNKTNSVCPWLQCFSLVGKIQ